ncbi:MAG: hypothetical protein EOM52_00735 [Clostridia bacterium]|nr:hypothetical protein [Clostridia bacterium]
MSKDRDKLNSDAPGSNDGKFSLESILMEYRTGPRDGPSEDLPWVKPKSRKEPVQNVVQFPGASRPPDGEDDVDDEEEGVPEEAPGLFEETPPEPDPDKVVAFPEEESPLQAGIGHLKRKADAYAETMFADEGTEVSDETLRIERLVPGVDLEEEDEEPLHRERKPRKAPPPPPDVAPSQLASRYGKGLGLLRLRSILVLLLSLPLLWLALAGLLNVPLPGAMADSFPLRVWASGGLLAIAMLLGADVLILGFVRLFLLKPGADTLVSFACALVLADAFTQLRLMPERETLPYASVCVLALFFTMWGTYAGRQGLRLSCRTAASASLPYIVSLDEGAWNGKDVYAKWSGAIHGFGSQIQEEDAVQKAYRIAAPLFLMAAFLFSLIASVGKGRPENFLWCLSAVASAATPFSGLILFNRPYRALARRLSSVGAALPGWSGAAKAGGAVLLNDSDLFPPGSVSLNGIKIFGDFSVEKVVGVTATMIRESGCGLDKIFHDLLRTQGATYRRTEVFERHEGGGLSAVIRGEQVLVGSAAFMALMEVSLPTGLNVRNAVFCAVEGELAGIFALNYTLHGSIPPALSALIDRRVAPVLATRDFNLIPAMLRQKFKLPVEKMDFPSVDRRIELSNPARLHSARITAVLCREGLGPYSEAVVGATRLRAAVHISTAISLIGSLVGLLLAFYLTYVAAYTSISAAQLTVFLLAWLVPTYLISGWVNRY